MRRLAFLLLTWSLLALPLAVWAAEVPASFQFDAGPGVKGLTILGKPLPVGTLLASGFRAEHRLRLTKLAIAGWGTPGALEVHVWRDDGGNQPGAPEGQFATSDAADRMTPRKVPTAANGEWVDVDLSDNPIEIEPLELFWVGVRTLKEGTSVAFDAIPPPEGTVTGMVQTPEAVTQCVDGCGIPGNLLLRAEGVYVDPVAKTWFTDITTLAGITSSGRVAIADYDDDGDDDVLIGGAQLWRNDGKAHFVDVTAKVGLSGLGGAGGVWGDYDNDGRLDIFVFGGREHLIHQNSDGTFVEANAGEFIEDPARDFPTEAASWVDVDNDGRLDVYTANYEVLAKDANGVDILGICDWHFLWKQDETGHFHDVAKAYGMHTKKECGRSVTANDWDQDGDQDIYVGNYRLNPNYLWQNDFEQPHMTDTGKATGTRGVGTNNDFGHTIGATWVDADDDGDFDLFVANLAHPRFIGFSDRSKFYQNLGADSGWTFSEHREMSGIGYLETHSNPDFADFDNDGDLDLSLTAVYKGRLGQFWRNDGRSDATWLTFSDATYSTGWIVDNGWGSAWGDLDGDGDLDQVVNKVFRNDYGDVSGDHGHWLKVKLHGTQKVNGAAIGAWVTIDLGDGKMRSRLVHGGHGVGCQDSLTLHFGLGKQTVVQGVTVHWPGLPAETFGPFAADQVLRVTEGQGATGKGVDAPDAVGDAAGDGLGADVGGDDTTADAAAPRASSGCKASPHRSENAGWLALFACSAAILGRRRNAATSGTRS